MNILVTGATGFIGHHLVKQLVNEGHTCRCLVRRLDGLDSSLYHPLIELYLGDITDPKSLEDIGAGIDVAYHLAGAGHVSSVFSKRNEPSFIINVVGTRNLIKACGLKSVPRFIHFSSTAAMGLIKRPKIDETTPCNPQTPYQKSKYAGELAALEEGAKYGMQVIILRPCMVYGPGGRGEFLKFCRLVNKGLFPQIGLGQNLTPIVHVQDVVRAAVNAKNKGREGQVYLIASDHSPPLADIHKFITEGLKRRRAYFYVPVWLAYSVAFFLECFSSLRDKEPVASRANIISTITGRQFDITKAKTELLYSPRVDMRIGIREVITWYKEHNLLK